MYVDKIERETDFIKTFVLHPVNGKSLPRFAGGAHIKTIIKNGDETIERHYSLTSNPFQRDYYSIAIRRDDASRGGSVYWNDKVQEGDQLEISYPKNHFPLSSRATHHVFYAAGIGITPFLTMMADLKEEGKSFQLHYAARSQEQCAFYDFITQNYPDQCNFYFSQDENSGRMSAEFMLNHKIGSHVYFCGPTSMVTQYAQAAASYGFPSKSIHYELFSPPETGIQQAFKVVLQSSNETIHVPEGKTLLESLLSHGIDAPYSCGVGGCGSCEVEVLEGEVDHRDLFYKDEEKKSNCTILTCISRAKKEKLVLNL
ncbi:oxidoreductase [Peribacillus sp. TH14]|nr:oxidoreductase [Peribacillus sp. TH14]